MKPAELEQLRQLAALRAQRSGAQLARIQRAINIAEDRAEALRTNPDSAPGSVSEAVFRDRWNRWRKQELQVLNGKIALMQSAAQPQREAHARDRARESVIDELSKGDGRRR